MRDRRISMDHRVKPGGDDLKMAGERRRREAGKGQMLLRD